MPRRLRLLLVSSLLSSACVSVFGPPEETPPEAPSARVLRFLPPPEREEVFPPPKAFESREWLDRVICPLGDQPGWKRTHRRGMTESFEIECPGFGKFPVLLDNGGAPPAAPAPLHLLALAGAAKFRESVDLLEKKDHAGALAAIDAARRADPAEPVYRRERIYALYSLGRTPEALMLAEELLEHGPDPIALKYRALAARDMGLRDEVLQSIEGIVASAPPMHPIYAEALCAKGMLTLADDEAKAVALMQQGCKLDHKPCCEFLEKRRSTPPAPSSSAADTVIEVLPDDAPDDVDPN